MELGRPTSVSYKLASHIIYPKGYTNIIYSYGVAILYITIQMFQVIFIKPSTIA